jgi:hypothetical protein
MKHDATIPEAEPASSLLIRITCRVEPIETGRLYESAVGILRDAEQPSVRSPRGTAQREVRERVFMLVKQLHRCFIAKTQFHILCSNRF